MSRSSALVVSHELATDAVETELCYALMSPITTLEASVPPHVQSLLDSFADVCTPPYDLPRLQDIQHSIDFVPGAQLPHYRMSPTEHAKLQRHVTDLGDKGYI